MSCLDKVNNPPYLLSHLHSDISETERLRIQHEHMRDVWCGGKLLHSSIPSDIPRTGTVADVGTGSGIWLLDLAQQGPETGSLQSGGLTRYVGFDISAARFPESTNPHITFLEHDATQAFPECYHGYFDFIHVRLLVYAIPAAQLSRVVANIAQILKPGGWLDWYEADNSDMWTVDHGSCMSAALEAIDHERADRGLIEYMPRAMLQSVLDTQANGQAAMRLLSFETRSPDLRTEEDARDMKWLMGTTLNFLLRGRIARLAAIAGQERGKVFARGEESVEDELRRCESLAKELERRSEQETTGLEARTTWLVARKLGSFREWFETSAS